MSEPEQTAEAAFMHWLAVYANTGDAQTKLHALMKMALQLAERVDSLDAEVGRLVDEIRGMQGARS